ncbi:RNA-directed DNA polymerase, eukaryota [Tanacetum coccineum]
MVMAHPVSSGSKFSNESLLERLSCNIFITNFPTTMSAKELWNTCAKYGTLLDVYIKVHDVDMLIRNLRSVWPGSFHLYANVARFNRDSKSSFSQKLHANEPLNVPRPSFAKVVKGSVIQQRNVAPVMVLERGTLNYEGDPVLVGCVKKFKTIPNIHHICSSEGFNGIKTCCLGGFWVLFEFDSFQSCKKFHTHAGIKSWFSSLKQWTSNFEIKDRVVWIDVEGTPLRAWSHATFQKIASKWGELVHMDLSNVLNKYSMRLCVKTYVQHLIVESFKVVLEGKVFYCSDDNVVVIHNWVEEEDDEVDPFGLEGLILKSSKKRNVKDVKESTVIPSNFDIPAKDGAKQVSEDNEPKFPPGFTPSNSDLPLNNENTVQDNVTSPVSMRTSSNRPDFNELVNIQGLGGQEKNKLVKMLCHSNQVNFLSLQETKMVSLDVFVVKAIWGNMYFDFATSSARGTWLALNSDLLVMHGEVIAMGDFNEVRCATKRYGSSFHKLNAAKFNAFIANSHLIDIPLSSYSFTWSDKYASRMSKLDRFLVSQGVLDLFPNMFGLILHRHILDHRPIFLKESQVDYGPIPFRLFHSWFLEPDFVSIVEDSWNNDGVFDNNAMTLLKNKLKCLKLRLKK